MVGFNQLQVNLNFTSSTSVSMSLLELISQKTNLNILRLLKNEPTYPRRLSGLLGMTEQKVVPRLRRLEQAGLLRSSWRRIAAKNVKVYEVSAEKVELTLGVEGLGLVLHPGERRRELSPPLYIATSLSRDPGFVGRERELELLKAAKFVIVEGIAGIGKSSLLHEFASRLPEGSKVFCHTFRETDSFTYLNGKLASFLGGLGYPDLLEYLKQGGSNDSEKLDFLVKGLDRPKRVLILDDYQRHHDDQIDALLGYLQRNLSKAKILLASRIRPPFLTMTPSLLELKLDGFTEEECSRFLEKKGLRLNQERKLRLYRKTSGHPLALVLICAVAPNDKGTLDAPSRVPAIENLSQEFLRSLSELERDVIIPLSAFRDPIPAEAVSEVLKGRRVRAALHYLERQMILKRTGEFYLLHELVREASYRMIDYPRELHRKIGEWYLRSDNAHEILEGLYHIVKSGDVSKANEILIQELVQEKFQFVEKGFSSALLDILDPILTEGLTPKEACCLLCMKAKVMSGLQKWGQAKNLLLKARKIAESLDEPNVLACVHKTMGKFYLRRGELPKGERNLKIAAELFRTKGDMHSLGRIYLDLARLHFSIGNLSQSLNYLDRLDPAARR